MRGPGRPSVEPGDTVRRPCHNPSRGFDSHGIQPILLKSELTAGHGGPSGRYQAWREEAKVLAFLLTTLGVERGRPDR